MFLDYAIDHEGLSGRGKADRQLGGVDHCLVTPFATKNENQSGQHITFLKALQDLAVAGGAGETSPVLVLN